MLESIRRCVGLIGLAALCLVPIETSANPTEDEYCSAFIDQLVPTRTAPSDEATVVLVGLWPMDIGDFDDRNQTFFADFYLALEWVDSRLTYEGLQLTRVDGSIIVADPYECDVQPGWMTQESRIWNPSLEFQGLRGDSSVRGERLLIYSDGTVNYEMRLSGTFKARFDFQNFPFDRQRIPLTVLPYSEVDEVVLRPFEEYFEGLDTASLMASADQLDVSGWNITQISVEATETEFGSEAYSQFNYVIDVERISTSMLMSFILPVMLITVLASAPFWVAFDNVDTRTSLSVTALLTLVAFNLVLRDRLPDLPYATLADIVNSISLLYTIAAVIIVVLLHFAERWRPEMEESVVDTWVRTVYPLSYLIIVSAVIFTALS